MRHIILSLLSALTLNVFAENNPQICRNDSGMIGFCNANGEVIISHRFYDAHDFRNGYAAVLSDNNWAIINPVGEVVSQDAYDDLYELVNMESGYLAQIGEKWQIIGNDGRPISDQYEVENPKHAFKINGAVAEFDESTWLGVSKKGKWGVTDMNDKVLVPFNYNWLRVISKGNKALGIVTMQKKSYAWSSTDLIYTSGHVFDDFLGENDKYLFFMKGESLVLLDRNTGDEITSPDKLFYKLTNLDGKSGLIHVTRGIIFPFEYDEIDIESVPNHVIFGQYEHLGIANTYGDVLLDPEYKQIIGLFDNPMVIGVRNQQGNVAIMAIDANKIREITPFEFRFARADGESIMIGKGNKLGTVAMDGTVTWR